MWDPGIPFVYLRGKVAAETKNPINMWIDDNVSLVTMQAIAMEEIFKQREVLKVKKETPRKQYMFTFEEGGWNTVWAKSLPGARKAAVAEYKDSPTLNPRLDSVHLATKSGLESAMSTFY